ncbi:MAG TPA: KH domain-containing protein [Candidatus Faecicola pullistercoris]|nr:KH domain-containing protein [Candidatus Faecicola pullistercoris]
MQELVQYLVDRLVGEGSDVDVELIENGYNSEIVITAGKGDIGKIIGKQGRIAKALRTIVRAASGKEDKKYTVIINEK